MKKKLVTLLLALACLFGLAGLTACDKKSGTQSDIGDSTISTDESSSIEDSSGEELSPTIPQELAYTLSEDGTYYIVSGIGTVTDTDIVIPSTYENIPVKEIAEEAFYDSDSLTSVIVGSNVEMIGRAAFCHCSNLISVIISNSVKTIQEEAFERCCKLVEVINESSLAIVKDSSDYGEVARYAKQVITDKENSKIIEKDEYRFYNDNGEYFLLGYVGRKKDIVLPESFNGELYQIYNYAFFCNVNIARVVISNGVTAIGEEAFAGCNIISVTVGTQVVSISDDAFDECVKIVEVMNYSNLPITKGSSDYGQIALKAKQVITNETESIIIKEEECLFYNDGGGYVFSGYMGNDSNVILPNRIYGNIYTIGDYAFCECTEVTSITIPDGVQGLGILAFYGCTNLTSVSIGNGVQTIGFNAFSDCTNLTSITIPDGVQTIERSAFDGCDNLTSVAIGNRIQTIGDKAFYYCYNLTNVYYKGTETEWEQISIGTRNDKLLSATRYYYSEEEPVGEGNYWRYVDGVPTSW